MEINIIPTGGLCNRMRAMATGVAVAKSFKASSYIYWNNDEGLKADFEELFQPIVTPKINIVENTNWMFNISNTKDYYMRWLFLHTMFDQVIFNHSIYNANTPDIQQIIKPSTRGRIMLVSCHPMCRQYNLKHLFVPQPDIQARISKVSQNFTNHTIGVHIRRTDNIQSIKRSPLEVFVQAMNREVEANPETMFYLASDDDIVKKQLSELFKKRIITMHNDTSRNSLKGMESAVTDLFCLSKTNKIIGSVYSSYSQIAAELGDIPIEYAMKPK
ncbi:MAG: hypothetical protein ACOYJK_08635 [Prevotella sp.]|jgi:hypothetical protein